MYTYKNRFETLIDNYAFYGRDTAHMSRDQIYELCYEYMRCVKNYGDRDTVELALPFEVLNKILKPEGTIYYSDIDDQCKFNILKSELQSSIMESYYSDISEKLDDEIERLKNIVASNEENYYGKTQQFAGAGAH